jgi:hypothetical protein
MRVRSRYRNIRSLAGNICRSSKSRWTHSRFAYSRLGPRPAGANYTALARQGTPPDSDWSRCPWSNLCRSAPARSSCSHSPVLGGSIGCWRCRCQNSICPHNSCRKPRRERRRNWLIAAPRCKCRCYSDPPSSRSRYNRCFRRDNKSHRTAFDLAGTRKSRQGRIRSRLGRNRPRDTHCD